MASPPAWGTLFNRSASVGAETGRALAWGFRLLERRSGHTAETSTFATRLAKAAPSRSTSRLQATRCPLHLASPSSSREAGRAGSAMASSLVGRIGPCATVQPISREPVSSGPSGAGVR